MIKKLETIVSGFTKGLLDGDTRVSKCFMVCCPLCSYLNFSGYEAELIEGEVHTEGEKHHHYWIQIKNILVDPTASQFLKPNGKKMPDLFIGECPSWYKPYP